jgi:hypothetical protein
MILEPTKGGLMTVQSSFTKVRNDLMHGFREKMSRAESTEDVRKFYVNTMLDLISRVVGQNTTLNPDDIRLSPESTDGYFLNPTVIDHPHFRAAWNDSDLPHIMDDFTQKALNRYSRLSTGNEKTRLKIHHTDGKR